MVSAGALSSAGRRCRQLARRYFLARSLLIEFPILAGALHCLCIWTLRVGPSSPQAVALIAVQANLPNTYHTQLRRWTIPQSKEVQRSPVRGGSAPPDASPPARIANYKLSLVEKSDDMGPSVALACPPERSSQWALPVQLRMSAPSAAGQIDSQTPLHYASSLSSNSWCTQCCL